MITYRNDSRCLTASPASITTHVPSRQDKRQWGEPSPEAKVYFRAVEIPTLDTREPVRNCPDDAGL